MIINNNYSSSLPSLNIITNIFNKKRLNKTKKNFSNKKIKKIKKIKKNKKIKKYHNESMFTKNVFNIFIAEISNSYDYAYNEEKNNFESENKDYNVYNFIPISLNLSEIKNIFFSSNTSYFNISDIISEKIKLSNQFFKNINNEIEPFIISNSIKRIYIEKNNYNTMDANTLIEIEKESKKYKSLYDFNYITNSLNFNELNHIINENNILDNEYSIKIRIKVYYVSKKTDIPCIMYFNYIIQNSLK